MTIIPRVFVTDPRAAVDFLRTVFDAQGEFATGRPADVRIGDARILVSDASERDAFPAFLYIYVADTDHTYAQAMAAGATSMETPRDTPYGDRRAMVRDPFGNIYQIATPTT
jgi:PhnB protein